MFKARKISLVIPCYNEEKGLEAILKHKPVWMDEVIVVDNNSKDQTAEVARRYGARVLRLEKKGYGRSYQKGLAEASGDIILMMDGDNTYPIQDAERFVRHLEDQGFDFVSGCRFPLSDEKVMPMVKRISNRFFSWFLRKWFAVNLQDSQSGMCAFRKAILPKILSKNPGMGFGQEIKLNAWLDPDLKTSEIRIAYRRRIGKVKYRAIQDGLKSFYDTFPFWVRRGLVFSEQRRASSKGVERVLSDVGMIQTAASYIKRWL